MKKILFICFSFLMIFALCSCTGNSSHTDLVEYIEKVKQKPAGSIEPLPSFSPFEAFVYSSAAIRSPFDLPVDVQQRSYVSSNKNIKPDFSREKEYLETFDLGALTMVGTLEQRETVWALIKDSSGGIHRVKEGNYMGKNHGKITRASVSNIELLEIVSDGLDGWVERPRVLTLSEKENNNVD